MARRAGFAISADEEALRCALEHLWSEITSPRGLRARINRLLPSVRTKTTEGGVGGNGKITGAAGSDGADELANASVSATWWNRAEIMDDLKEV